MSANNKLVIWETKDKDWEIKNVDLGGGGSFAVSRQATLKKAIEFAEKYMEENEVEYGYRIVYCKGTEI